MSINEKAKNFAFFPELFKPIKTHYCDVYAGKEAGGNMTYLMYFNFIYICRLYI